MYNFAYVHRWEGAVKPLSDTTLWVDSEVDSGKKLPGCIRKLWTADSGESLAGLTGKAVAGKEVQVRAAWDLACRL